ELPPVPRLGSSLGDVRGLSSAARPRPPLAPLHAAAGLVRRGAADDRARRGLPPDRRRRAPLPRRRLLALVQRPRPSPSRDRPGRARAARQGRALDYARPLPPRSRQARGAPRRDRPTRPLARLLLRLGLDCDGDRPEDGLPVPAAA